MFNEQQGWALSENDQTWPAVYGIVRTTDGGQTWQDMTPPGYTLHGPMAGFVSPTMAWVVMPQADNSTTQIIHTTDGGQTWQGSTIGANAITHVTFLDGQHGWLLASTDNDQHFDLWRTTDGTTWQDIAHVTPFQAGNSQLQVSGLSFVNASTGWLTGQTVTNVAWLYVTHDGGQSWQQQALSVPSHVQSFNPQIFPPSFINDHDGFLVINGAFLDCAQQGSMAILYATHDGGATWNSTSLTSLSSAPTFINSTQGWLLKDKTLKTTNDGGQSWEDLPANPTFQSALNIQSIQFVSSSVGWASGRDRQKFPLLLKTTDGGRTWSVVKAQEFSAEQTKLTMNSALQPAGSPPGLALPAPTHSNLPASLPTTPSVVNIHMFDSQNGWGQTPGGKYEIPHLLHTSDGGKTWQDVLPQDQRFPQAYGGPFLADTFLNTSTAWFAITTNNPGSTVTSIYRTSDGGHSWQESHITLNISNSTLSSRQITFSDANHGWLLLTSAQDQTNAELASIYNTSDGGQHWTQLATTGASAGTIPLNGNKAAISFLNAQVGWLTIGDYFAAVPAAGLYKTTDGGHTWHKQSLSAPSGPHKSTAMTMAPTFSDASYGILPVQYYNDTSSAGIILYISHNAGASWQVASTLPIAITGTLSSATIGFLDAHHGWIIDGYASTLYMTSDGGHHWSKHAGFNGLQAVSFASARLGWAEDSNSCSLLLSTINGGQSWSAYHYTITS